MKFEKMNELPLSFMVNGEKITLNDNRVETLSETKEENITTTDFIIKDFNLQITSIYEEISEFNACEWYFRLSNIGDCHTPIINKLLPCDITFNLTCETPTLHYAKGGYCTEEDFRPYNAPLEKQCDFKLWAEGGRSSGLFLPFFNMSFGDYGYLGSIGWTGDWECNWYRRELNEDKMNFTMGMRETCFYLYPGESVRTPKMSFIEYKGDIRKGQNKLRQYLNIYHNHILNRTGKTGMPLFCSYWGDTPCDIHVKNATLMCENNVDFDYYWIDAAWFGKKEAWMPCTGDWDYIKPKYPNKFKPLTDVLDKYNKKFLLWFEPERVCEGTGFMRLGDYLIDMPKESVYPRTDAINLHDPRFPKDENFRNTFGYNEKLIDLGNPEACEWYIDYFSNFINENKIKFYRNDANVAVDAFIKSKDRENRIGISEMKWIEGLYKFWDGLLDNCPDLLIDNCASGGRRMDIEMFDRSVPLWRTDYAGVVNARQSHSLGLNEWFINHGSSCGNLSKNHSPNVEYDVVSGMTAGLTYTLFSTGDIEQPDPYTFDIDYDDVNNTVAKYRKLQPYFQYDYYPLSTFNVYEDGYVVYAFYSENEDKGMLVVINRKTTPVKNIEFDFDFANDKKYDIEYVFGNTSIDINKKKLNIEFKEKNTACVVLFK